MKIFYDLLKFVILLSCFLWNMAYSQEEINELARDNKKIKNTTLILESKLSDIFYCNSYSKNTTNLIISLRYKNIGKTNIILYYHPFIADRRFYYQVKENEESPILLGKEMPHGTIISGKFDTNQDPRYSEMIIIKPGQSYIVDNYFVKFHPPDKGKKSKTDVGHYAIRFIFNTFPFQQDVRKLGSEWQSYGNLWTNVLGTDYIFFDVDYSKFKQQTDCQKIPLQEIKARIE